MPQTFELGFLPPSTEKLVTDVSCSLFDSLFIFSFALFQLCIFLTLKTSLLTYLGFLFQLNKIPTNYFVFFVEKNSQAF